MSCSPDMTPPPPADITTLSVAAPAAVLSAVFATLGYGIFHPRASVFGRVWSRAPRETAGARVALTFDDGPTPGPTDRVLDALTELRVRATFFVIGRNAERWPELVRRMDAEGHAVANHTYDHSHTGAWHGWGYWRREIARADQVITGIIGRRPAMFRPPMGLKTYPQVATARWTGHEVIAWARRAYDTRAGTTAERIVERLAGRARAGEILMLHDGVEPYARRADRSATCDAIRPLVTRLRQRGLQLVRADELLGLRAY